jgi:hypothetical protein
MVNLFYILDIYGFCYNEADSVISDFHSSGIEIGTGFSSPPGERVRERGLSLRGKALFHGLEISFWERKAAS